MMILHHNMKNSNYIETTTKPILKAKFICENVDVEYEDDFMEFVVALL